MDTVCNKPLLPVPTQPRRSGAQTCQNCTTSNFPALQTALSPAVPTRASRGSVSCGGFVERFEVCRSQLQFGWLRIAWGSMVYKDKLAARERKQRSTKSGTSNLNALPLQARKSGRYKTQREGGPIRQSGARKPKQPRFIGPLRAQSQRRIIGKKKWVSVPALAVAEASGEVQPDDVPVPAVEQVFAEVEAPVGLPKDRVQAAGSVETSERKDGAAELVVPTKSLPQAPRGSRQTSSATNCNADRSRQENTTRLINSIHMQPLSKRAALHLQCPPQTRQRRPYEVCREMSTGQLMSTTAAPSASLRAAPSSFRRAQKLTAAWPTFSASKFFAEFPSPPRARKEPSTAVASPIPWHLRHVYKTSPDGSWELR